MVIIGLLLLWLWISGGERSNATLDHHDPFSGPCGLTALSSSAAVRDPDGGQVPFYARIARGGFAVSDGDRTLIYFYRPPERIPEDFNLLEFFDILGASGPGAFGCQPATTEGHAIWETGIFVDPAPLFSKLKGLGAVPVWFVDTDDYQNAISDGELTVGELDGLNPQKGTASHFNEVLRPSEVENIRFSSFEWLESWRMELRSGSTTWEFET